MGRFSWIALGLAAALLTVLAASCSTTAEGPAIEIRDEAWTAVPSTTEAGGSFVITVTNQGTESQDFAVLMLRAGDPNALPMRDGLVDLRQDQPFSDTQNPAYTYFDVVYPEYERREGEGVDPETLIPETIEPGEQMSITIGNFKGGGEPGTYVVLSYQSGGYEAGKYAVFTITDG